MTQRDRDQMMTQPWVAPLMMWQRSMQQAFRLQLSFLEQMRELWTNPMSAGGLTGLEQMRELWTNPMSTGALTGRGGAPQSEVVRLPEAQVTARDDAVRAAARGTGSVGATAGETTTAGPKARETTTAGAQSGRRGRQTAGRR